MTPTDTLAGAACRAPDVVAKRLAMFWRWHLVDTHGKGAT